MSFKAIDDINNTVANTMENIRRKNTQIVRPNELRNHLDSISKINNQYKEDYARINAEAIAHQDGGQFRKIESPQNLTTPTAFMQNVFHTQNEQEHTITKKCIEVKQARESIKNRKKETDGIIHQLYDSLLNEFKERCVISS